MPASKVHLSPLPLTQSQPDPAADYATALEKFATLQSLDGDDLNPVCHSTLLTHDRKTDRVVVLLHGITNCPQQYATFAPQLFERGCNVFIPRMPRNGLADRMTNELQHLKAQELRTFCDDICDIAAGLGDRVVVTGL